MIKNLVLAWKKDFVFLILCVGILIMPLCKQQILTGTFVNFSLFLAASFLGTKKAYLLGCFPSFIALFSGILPLAFAPLIPVIILSNGILIHFFQKTSKYPIGILFASCAKTSFLLLTGFLFFPPFFFLLQLTTALMGGICYLLSKDSFSKIFRNFL